MTYYRTTVVDVGPEAGDMAAAGVVILFAEPLPEALAEMSVVHRPSQTLAGHPVSAGDVISVGGAELQITAVGDLAAKNLEELGHIVLYVDQPNQKLLPGAVLATGGLPPIERDAVIEFRTGA